MTVEPTSRPVHASPASEDRHPEEPRPPRARDVGDAALPQPRDRRAVLRAGHLHGLPDVLLGGGPGGRSSGAPSTATSTRRRCRSSSQSVIESGHGSTIEHVVFTFAITGVVADPVAPARPPSGGRRLRPAEPALRQVQGRGDDAARTPSPRATRTCASATRRRSTARSSCTATCSAPACPARTPASSSRTRPARTSS